jgi:uncharacterized damage-inducible protein DinB
MHQDYRFIVTLIQTLLLHVSAHQHHHQGAYTIFTSYVVLRRFASQKEYIDKSQ